MPDYASLSTQIDAIKSEITASLNSSTYTAQDLIFLASALDKLGTMLGVNDIVAATAAKVAEINSTATLSVITESGTSRTLSVVTDSSNIIKTTSSSAITITVPANSSQAFPIGSSVEFLQAGSGQITFSAAGGVTILSADNLYKSRVTNSSVGLLKIDTDTWLLSGDLAL